MMQLRTQTRIMFLLQLRQVTIMQILLFTLQHIHRRLQTL
jgi:hypothetical protein